jgi:stearoyl-CoA desaturase (delta-9 desaturase)
MLYGILNLSIWGYVIATLILTHITILGVTIYLHRDQTHRALDVHSSVAHFFRFWLWLTTGMVTKAWVAIHRKHHARCETPDDPHSPQILGLSKVLWEGAELYRKESKNQETMQRYGQGTPNDWIENKLYTPHSGKGILLMLFIDLLLFGVPGITVWAIQMAWIPFFAAGVVNGVGHYFGYRNFECADAARNLIPWGVIIGGEELHNNHHAFPTSAKFSVKWWEFDLAWGYIRALQIFNLVKVKRLPPKLQQSIAKSHADMEALKVIIANRLQVMAHYSKAVILPVLQEEKRKACATSQVLLRRAKTLLTRADALIDENSKQGIAKILEGRQALTQVYQYRLKLQDIWNRTTASQAELLEALQEWCKQAESTGIAALSNFAAKLKGYAVIKR